LELVDASLGRTALDGYSVNAVVHGVLAAVEPFPVALDARKDTESATRVVVIEGDGGGYVISYLYSSTHFYDFILSYHILSL
jgi:hypothetical protein